MSNNFASMVAQVRSPAEDFVDVFISRITKVSTSAGYTMGYSIMPPAATDVENNICVITFKFNNGSGELNANAQIKYTNLTGAVRVHSTQGFPPEFGATLLDLSKAAVSQADSKGVQAVVEDYPAKAQGSGKVEAQPGASNATDKQVCEAVIASIDLGTTIGFIKKDEPTRQYIGSSGIGETCMAYHALSLRGFPSDTPSPQLIRIFDQGHRIEEMVVAALREAGHTVEAINPSANEQWEYTSHGGHHVCHLDGFILLAGSGERMTLEIKSVNRKLFESFEKKGVKLSHPHYYDQVVDGLALVDNGFINKCLFVAYCKDNSKYAVEIVHADADRATALRMKVDAATIFPTPIREGSSQYEYKCSQCFKKTSCWSPNVPVQTCVQCRHAVPVMTGGKAWHCRVHDTAVPQQICSSFQLFRPNPKGKI